MKITLTQENIRSALGLYLEAKGVSIGRAADLDVEFIITRKGGTNVSAEVNVPDFPAGPVQTVEVTGSVAPAKVELILDSDGTEDKKDIKGLGQLGEALDQKVDPEPEAEVVAEEEPTTTAEEAAQAESKAEEEKQAATASLFG